MRNSDIILVGKSHYFKPYLNELKIIFESMSHSVTLTETYQNEPADLVIVINPLKQYPYLRFKKSKTIYACIQTEQLYHENIGGYQMTWHYVKRLKSIHKRYDLIFDWSHGHVTAFKRKYPKFEYVPHGVFDALKPPSPIPSSKEYDLFFVGNPTGIDQRRAKLLKRLKEKYTLNPNQEDLWGEDKFLAMSKAKICLNIHFDHSLCFESPRLYEYFHNKCFVLSEFISDSTPFVDGEDFIAFDESNIESLIDYYLNHEDEMDKIAENAFLKAQNYPLEKTAFKMLQYARVSLNSKSMSSFKVQSSYYWEKLMKSLKPLKKNLIKLIKKNR